MVSIPIDSNPFDNDDASGWEIKWWPSYLAYVAAFEHPSLSLQQHHLTSCAFICEYPYLLCAWFTFINFNFLPIASRNFVLPRTGQVHHLLDDFDLKFASFLLAPDRETLQDFFFDWQEQG